VEVPTYTGRSQDQSTSTQKSLCTLWLTLARGGWIGIAGTCVLLLAVALPVRYTQLAHPPTQIRTGLLALGLPLKLYVFSNLLLDGCVVLGFFMAAALLFWRKSNEWFPLLVAFLLITFGTGGPIIVTLQEVNPAWSPLTGLIDIVSWGLLSFFLSLFPDGRFVPRWALWYTIVFGLYGLLWDIPLPAGWHPSNWPLPLFILLQLGPTALLLGFQIYRYRYVSGPVQRQQAKWLLFGLAVALCTIPFSIASVTPTHTPATIFGLFVAPALHLLWLCIPFTLSIAILRYRLWDIDIIINRTLAYGTLTVLLTGIYVGLVIGLPLLLRGVVSQDNSVAIVISTLVVAALFQPLRHRIQAIIDRRFYRRKYDAAKIVATFSSTLREELDLPTLSEHLLAVVQETMQPAQVSLWLVQRGSITGGSNER
jgi:hypothetical protein